MVKDSTSNYPKVRKMSERNKNFQIQGLANCKAHAKLKGGKFLSSAYTSNSFKYEWECECSYRWFASWSNIKIGKWCPKCAGKRQTINDLKAHARTKNGECLSKHYTNQNK